MVGSLLALLTLLTIKHFIADFLYQPPYQWQNKGTFGHPGGLVHAGQHAFLTAAIVWWFVPALIYALVIAAGEFVIHYVVDWAKMNINKAKGWGANTHNEFWILLGVDQLLHSLTYIAIAAIVFVLI